MSELFSKLEAPQRPTPGQARARLDQILAMWGHVRVMEQDAKGRAVRVVRTTWGRQGQPESQTWVLVSGTELMELQSENDNA